MNTPTPQTLSLAMTMIDRRNWRMPAQVIDMVRFLTIDAPDVPIGSYRALADRQASELLYGDPQGRRNARRALENLVADSVLECVPGAGRRPSAYRINPDFGQWQNVPWRPSRGAALTRLAAFVASLGTAKDPRFAVPHVTALPTIMPLSIGRHKNQLVPSSGGRHNVAPFAVTWGTAQISDSEGSHLFSERDESLSLSDLERETVQKVISAVCRRVGIPTLWGQPRRIIERLACSGASADELLSLVARGPNGARQLMLVQWMAEQWQGERLQEPGPDPAQVRERVAMLQRRRATLEELEDVEGVLQIDDELADIGMEVSDLDICDDSSENDLVG